MTQYQYRFDTARRRGLHRRRSGPSGMRSEGDTKEEALANIQDAIEGYLLVAKKHNLYPFAGIQKLEEVEVVSGVLQYA